MRISTSFNFKQCLHYLTRNSQFVPDHLPVAGKEVKELETFLMDKPNTLVLTGAGISTESGIPDYRSEKVGMYARTSNRPVQHMDFIKSAKVRQRYWARNYVAWPSFSNVSPNQTHYALARFEREDRISGIITQNVDRLHRKAGSKKVTELHGSGYTVICLNCDYRIDRHDFQQILDTINPKMIAENEGMRPDGDILIPQEYIDNFQIPSCPKCDGNLKPEIVFFGDNVPKDRIEMIAKLICCSDGLLVLGSSLTVFSGYRILLNSYDLGLPIAIVNIGPTRGDDQATIRISVKCGDVIPKLFNFSTSV